MKYIKYNLLIVLVLVMTTRCDLEELDDPNRPTLGNVPVNATIATLNNLVAGTLANMLVNYGTYIDAVGIAGRDHYRFSPSDPRFVGDLLTGNLDNNAFYTTNAYTARYRTVRNAEILIEAAENSPFASAAEIAGYTGIAKTIQAHELLLVLNQQNENGIRIDVSDFENLGEFVSSDAALAAISSLLNEGLTDLNNAGTEFAFVFGASSGFVGLDSPGTFAQFNRALAARVFVYREMWTDALTALNASFLDLNGSLTLGAYYDFEQGAGLTANDLFFAPNGTGDVRLAHPDFLNSAEAGDTRVAAFAQVRDEALTRSMLTGTHDVLRYTSLNDNVPIITNEELALIFAEANINTNNSADAITAINVVRNAAGIGDYAGATDQASLLDEMLNQRRYSLYFLGHRWVDMRRYNRLDQIVTDRAGDNTYTSFPRPQQEALAEGGG